MKTFAKMILMTLMMVCLGIAAEAKDPASEQAMKETQDFLKNSKERNAYIQKDDKAKQADQVLNSVTGGNKSQNEEIYGLSAEIFANFDGMTAEQMQEVLAKAARDPASFLNSLTPEQKEKLKNISGKIEAGKAKP